MEKNKVVLRTEEPGLNGPQLRDLRKSVFMPARLFAKEVGYSYQHYRRIEASKSEVPLAIKTKFKSVLIGHVEKMQSATRVLQNWNPGISKLDIRGKIDGNVRLSRKGV